MVSEMSGVSLSLRKGMMMGGKRGELLTGIIMVYQMCKSKNH